MSVNRQAWFGQPRGLTILFLTAIALIAAAMLIETIALGAIQPELA
jgi:hypothetical protein